MFASGLERAGTATLQALLLLELLLLIGFLVCCVNCGQRFDANSGIAIAAGMLGVSAMAVQTALVQISLTKAPSTAVMTTNIAHFMLALGELLTGRDAAVIASARKKAIHIFPVILGFGIGCALGAAAQSAYGSWSLALPAALATLALATSVMVSLGFRSFRYRVPSSCESTFPLARARERCARGGRRSHRRWWGRRASRANFSWGPAS